MALIIKRFAMESNLHILDFLFYLLFAGVEVTESRFPLVKVGFSFLFQHINSNTEIDRALQPIHNFGAQPRTFPSPARKAAPEEALTSSVSNVAADVDVKTKEFPSRRSEASPAASPAFENSGATVAPSVISPQSPQSTPKRAASPASIPAASDSDDVINSRPSTMLTTSNAISSSASSTFHLLTQRSRQATTPHKYLESSMSTATSVNLATTASPYGDRATVVKSDEHVAGVAQTRSIPGTELSGGSNPEAYSDKEFVAPSYSVSHFLGSTPAPANQSRDSFWAISLTSIPSSMPEDVDVVGASRSEQNGSVSIKVTSALEFLDLNTVELTTATVMLESMATEYLRNGVSSQPSSDSQVRKEEFILPAGTVAGIVVASIGFVCILAGENSLSKLVCYILIICATNALGLAAALGLFVFRRFRSLHSKSYDNKYNGDNCSYLDSLQVSYINNHIELPKESSDEMLSLDNDSFLNSLEAMTMENYWAEDRRSTKV